MKKYILSILLPVLMLVTIGCDSSSKTESNKRQLEKKSDIIIDDAYVLLEDEKLMKMYREYNQKLLKEFDIDFRVITISDDEDINIYTNRAFKKLQKESRSRSGKALLLVVNTKQDRVRMEVSVGLEPIYTDAMVSYVERKGMVPYLREYKIADGIYMVTELVRDRAYEAREGKEFMPPMKSSSIGGGAKNRAYIGMSDPDAKKGAAVQSYSSDTPKIVLHKYIEALKSHNKNPNLDIYTDTTKKFFKKWVVTDINQNHEVENISKCIDMHKTITDKSNTHALLAAIPYDKYRKCSPYFFKKENGSWKLDIASMAQMLHFNADMQWHFDKVKRLDGEGIYYAYAFDGYGFDKNGYPFTPKDVHPDWKKYRWGYTCGQWYHPKDSDKVKTDPKKYIRCWIKNYAYGMPANVRLGLEVQDYVQSVGEGIDRIDNVSYVEFMEYMKRAPSGSIVTVEVNHKGKTVIKKGIAP